MPSSTPIPLSLVLSDFPLAVGTTWIYSAEISYQDPGDPAKFLTWTGTVTDRIINQQAIPDGNTIFKVQEDLDPAPPDAVWRHSGTFEYIVSGDGVYIRDWKVYQYPLADNIKWEASSGSGYEVVAQAEANGITPGRSGNCYTLITETNPDTTMDTFCQGIGFVKHLYTHHGTLQDEKFTLASFTIGQP